MSEPAEVSGHFPSSNQPRAISTSASSKLTCCINMSAVLFQVFGLLVVALCLSVRAGPLHASCRIQWTFGETCKNVQNAIVSQIKTWGGPDGCANGGEKCLYAIKSQEENKILATHTTPKKHYVDDLSFTFTTSQNSCSVQGYSTSETWYAVLDYGTNYCNLHNLITGSGLDKVTGYKETTSDSICTQYSSADCGKY